MALSHRDAPVRLTAAARVAARFLYENGVGDVDQIRAFTRLDAEAFALLRRSDRWGARRRPPAARTLAVRLAAVAGEAPDPADSQALAASLRRFAAARLETLAADAGEKGAARDVVDLTRCLKELAALESAVDRERARSDDDAAAMVGGTTSDLAEIVALEIERLHQRVGAGGGLAALYPSDEDAPRE